MDKTCCRVSGRDNAIDDDDVMMMIMMMIPLKMIKVMRMMMLLMVVQLMIIMSIFIIINDITFFFFIMTIILLRRNYKYETSIRQLQQCLRSGRLHGWIDKRIDGVMCIHTFNSYIHIYSVHTFIYSFTYNRLNSNVGCTITVSF